MSTSQAYQSSMLRPDVTARLQAQMSLNVQELAAAKWMFGLLDFDNDGGCFLEAAVWRWSMCLCETCLHINQALTSLCLCPPANANMSISALTSHHSHQPSCARSSSVSGRTCTTGMQAAASVICKA